MTACSRQKFLKALYYLSTLQLLIIILLGMNKKSLVAIGMATVLVTAGAGCSSTATVDTTQNSPQPQVASQDTVPVENENANTNSNPTVNGEVSIPEIQVGTTMEAGPEVKEFTVTGGNFKFAPNTLSVKKGDKVRIVFKNAEGFHDFKIDEFNVATKQIQGGAEETVEFTADKAGSFEYYCSVGKHRAMGMKGTLTVTE